MKISREWFVNAPWGKIALISWGNPQGKPVLLVHGRQDSAATFIPLLEVLPDDYYYIGIDLPGHGKSDPLPIGTALTRFFFVVVVDMVVKELNLKEFIYIGHSMGSEIGLFFNAIYPGRIRKLILLDAGPALQRLVIYNFPKFYSLYNNYYSNYNKNNVDNRVYTEQQAVRAVMKARDMTEDQAKLILSRNLVRIGEDKYRLSWDRRTKALVPTNYPPEQYYKLFSKAPPTLYISANQSSGDFYKEGKKIIDDLILKLQQNVDFTVLRVDGTHDVHFTHPERFSKELCAFLHKDVGDLKSKL